MNRTILLGEDDLPVRIMLARVLKAAGYEVVLSGSANEAVAAFREAKPDLVLLDLKLPGAEGWKPFDDIRRSDPTMPIIATSAFSNQHDQAAERGIDTLIEKPLDLALLLELVSRLLAETQEARADRRRNREGASPIRAAA